MKNILENGIWFIWLYILVFVPFKIYDFLKLNNRRPKHYADIAISLILSVIFLIGCFSGTYVKTNKNILISENATYILVIIAYLQCLVDFIESKSKRNLLFLLLFTITLLTYLSLLLFL